MKDAYWMKQAFKRGSQCPFDAKDHFMGRKREHMYQGCGSFP